MGGLLLLVGLCVVMALTSFLAGALPLSMTLSQSQLRLISSIGVGVLVGTSLIVIIPEGIEAAAMSMSSHARHARGLTRRVPWNFIIEGRNDMKNVAVRRSSIDNGFADKTLVGIFAPQTVAVSLTKREDEPTPEAEAEAAAPAAAPSAAPAAAPEAEPGLPGSSAQSEDKHDTKEHAAIPAFEVGFSMVLGFVLMFLIDRLPRHATDTFQPPQTTHMSLDNLGGDGASVDEEAEGFLGSLAPTPRRSRGLATTMGLVIHAAADGIAMGASSVSSNMKLGLIIFAAIMIHKAPAAFGLTSVLLRQGLSKRAARSHLIVFSLAAPVGALSTWLLVTLLGGGHLDGEAGQWWTGMLLLFSGGTFLYVAMHAMREGAASHNHDHAPGANGYADGAVANQRKAKGPRMRDTLATVAGMFLPLLTQFGHGHPR